MPRLSDEDIQKMQVATSTVKEHELGYFYHTDYPQDKFDNRKEAWYSAIEKNEAKRLQAVGRDENAQTPAEKKAFEARRKKSEDTKRKAELAAEMVMQNK